MKLCSFTHDGVDSFGLVKDDHVIDLTKSLEDENITDLRSLIESGLMSTCEEIANSSSLPSYSIADIQFQPVIPNPGKILCVGINYHTHQAETQNPDYQHPMFFSRYPEAQVGHLQPLLRPRESDKLDYEGELAAIIGKPGRRIKREDALSHVVGYSCYNDGSVRDWQRHTPQFLPGKNFVGTGPFGPWMVTTDEIPDPSQLKLETRYNGQTVQSTTTDLMIHPVPVLIEYISTVLPLNPGDVIVTGTPSGIGARRNPRIFMKDGDIIEVEISKIGVLRNTVQDE